MKKKINIPNITFTLIIIFSFICIYILNKRTPIIADDYSYSFIYSTNKRITNIIDILQSQWIHYNKWGGRSVVHSLAQLFLLIPKSLFNIINSFGYVLLTLLIYFHSSGVRKLKPLLLIAINLLLWFFVPVFGQTILWVTGSSNYLWGSIIVLLFLLPYRLSFDNSITINNSVLKTIFMFLLGVLAGWTNENTAVGAIFLVVIYMIYILIKKLKNQIWAFSGFLGSIIGFIIMVCAPGNFVRANDPSFKDYRSKISIIFERFENCTKVLIDNSIYLLIFLIILLLIIMILKIKNVNTKVYLSLIFYFGGFISIYSMVLSPTFPQRAYFGIAIFIIISVNILLSNLLESKNIYVLCMYFVVLSLVIPQFINTYIFACRDLSHTNNEWINRINTIEIGKKNNNNNIVVKKIEPYSQYNPLYGLADLNENAELWPNNDVAKYFNINSISIDKNQ